MADSPLTIDVAANNSYFSVSCDSFLFNTAKQIRITYSIVIVNDIRPQETVVQVVSTEYTSTPYNASNIGRYHSSTNGAYPWFQGQTSITMIVPTIAISLFATSLPETLNANVNIGETTTFRMLVTFPEGFMNASVRVTLPLGLVYRNATVLQIGSNLLDSLLPVGSVVNATVSNTSLTTFNFGPIRNIPDNVVNGSDQMLLEFLAQVNDIVNVTNNLTLTTLSQVIVDAVSPIGSSTNVRVMIPTFTTAVSVTPTTVDAGDIVTYTVTVTAGAAAPGYDMTVAVTINSGFINVVNATNGTDPWPYTIAANNLSVTWNVGFLNNSFTFVAVIKAIILNTMKPATNGLSATSVIRYDTCRDTPFGLTGRNFTTASSSGLLVIPSPTYAPITVNSSIDSTVDPEVAIGETIVLTHKISMPEETSRLMLRVYFPDVGRAVLVDHTTFLANTISCNVSDNFTFTSNPDVVTYDLGTCINYFDNNATNDVNNIIFTSYIAPTDVFLNNQSAALRFFTTLFFSDGTSLVTNRTINVSRNFTIVEPVLSIRASVSPLGPMDAGDNVTYTVTTAHVNTSRSAAFDLNVTSYVQAQYMDIVGATQGTPAWPFVIAADRKSITWFVGYLNVSTSQFVATYTAQVLNTALPVTTGILSLVNATFDSNPGAPYGQPGRNVSISNSTVSISISQPTCTWNVTNTSVATTITPEISVGEILYLSHNINMPEVTSRVVVKVYLPDVGRVSLVDYTIVLGSQVNCTLNGAPTTTSNPDTITYDLGVCVNWFDASTSNDISNIVITSILTATNTVNNTQLAPIRLNSTFFYSNGATTGNLTINNSLNFTIVEPVLNIRATVSPLGPMDAGDNVTYTLTTYHLNTSRSAAYDVNVTSFVQAQYMDIVGATQGTPAWPFAIASDRKSITWFVGNLNVGTGQFVSTYTAQVLNTALPVTTGIFSLVNATYDSNPGSPYGQPGRNASTGNSTVSISISEPTYTWNITNTSVATTVTPEISIGEILYLAHQISLPEVTSRVVVKVYLPNVGRVSLVDYTIVLDPRVNCTLNGAPTTTSNPDTITYDLGVCVNWFDNVAANNVNNIVITSILTANNMINNTQLAPIRLNSTFFYSNGATAGNLTINNSLNFTIVEPVLNIRANVSTLGPLDAGDNVTYTLTTYHLNTSRSTAYDLNVTAYVRAEYMDIVGATQGTPAWPFTIAPDRKSITWAVGFLNVNTSQFVASCIAQVLNTALPVTSGIFANVSATYDSNPGAPYGQPGRNVTTGNNTFAITILEPTYNLSLTNTSVSTTTSPQISIGEIIYLAHQVNLPEVTSRIEFKVYLPGAGRMTLVDHTVQLGSQVTCQFPNANVVTTLNPDVVYYDLGICVNTFDNLASTDNLNIIVTSILAATDVPTNNFNATLPINTTFFYSNGASGNNLTISRNTSFTVVEPVLTIRASVTPMGPLDAGDNVTYTVVVSHTALSQTAAYDVNVTAAVRDEYVDIIGASQGTPAWPFAIAADRKTITWFVSVLTPGTQQFVATFDAQVLNTVLPDAPGLLGLVNVTYDSNPQAPYGQTGRVKTANNVTGALAVDIPTLAIALTNTSDYTTINNDVAVGETVEFTITIVLPEVTSLLNMTVQFPHMQMTGVGSKVQVGSNINCTATPVFIEDSNNSLVFDMARLDFGACIDIFDNSPRTAADTIIVVLSAIVLDEANVRRDAILTTTVSLSYSYTLYPTIQLGGLTQSSSVRVVEPSFVLVLRQPSNQHVRRGATVDFSLRLTPSFGHDVKVTLSLPDKLHYNLTTFNPFGLSTIVPPVVTAGLNGQGTNVTLLFGSIELTDQVEFDLFTFVDINAEPGLGFDVVATLYFISNPNPSLARAGSDVKTYLTEFVVFLGIGFGFDSFLPQTNNGELSINEVIRFHYNITVRGTYQLTLWWDNAITTDTGIYLLNVLEVNTTFVGSRITLAQQPVFTIDAVNDSVVADFSVVQNMDVTPTRDTRDMISVTVTATVENVPQLVAALQGTTADFTEFGGVEIRHNVSIELLEPQLVLDSDMHTPSISVVEAGHILTFDFAVTALNFAGAGPGYDLNVLTLLNFTDAQSGSAPNTETLQALSNSSVLFQHPVLLVDNQWNVTWSLPVADTVPPGVDLGHTVHLDYDSLLGHDSEFARLTGRAYTVVPQQHFMHTKDLAFSMIIRNTTGFGPDMNHIPVGEIVELSLTVFFPRCTAYGIQVRVAFPTELVPVLARVGNFNGVFSTTGQDSGNPVLANGSVVFDFGNLRYPALSAGNGQLNLQVQLRLDDVPTVVNNLVMNVTAEVTYGSVQAQQSHADSLLLTVVEPFLTQSFSVTPEQGDAGDLVTVVQTVSHLPNSTNAAMVPDFSTVIHPFFQFLAAPLYMAISPQNVTAGSAGDYGLTTVVGHRTRLELNETIVVTHVLRLRQSTRPGQLLPTNIVTDYSSVNLPHRRLRQLLQTHTFATYNLTSMNMTIGDFTGSYTRLVPNGLSVGEESTTYMKLTLPEGTSSGLSVLATLPTASNNTAVLVFIRAELVRMGANINVTDFSLIVNGSASPLSTGRRRSTSLIPILEAQAAQSVVVNLGTVVNFYDNIANDNDSVTIALTSVVADNPRVTNGYQVRRILLVP